MYCGVDFSDFSFFFPFPFSEIPDAHTLGHRERIFFCTREIRYGSNNNLKEILEVKFIRQDWNILKS